MMLLLPSLRRDIRHILERTSRHPWRMVSPFNENSQLLEWKNTSHSVSHSTDTDRRLLMRFGARCASLAALCSLLRRRSNVLVVNILAPDGWRIVLVGSWMAASFSGAPSVAKDTLAAESTNAVVFKSGGFEHPECVIVLFAK